MSDEIYLDHAASAPILPEVADHISVLFKRRLGNSSSVHFSGVKASTELEKARIKISSIIGSSPDELFFTSGATESNNIIFSGLPNSGRKEIIVSAIEHTSVLEAANEMKRRGFIIKYADVDSSGHVSPEKIRSLISEETLLVSVMHANNEIGTVQDLKSIGRICRDMGILFHSDCAQSFCKIPINVNEMNIDFLTLSSHKIHGPRGAGAVYIRHDKSLSPLFFGGGQENGLRPGTVAVEMISAMAKAAAHYDVKALNNLEDIRNSLKQELTRGFSNVRFHGSEEDHLPNILNFALRGHSAKELLTKLDAKGIRASAGSACLTGKKTPSHVLKAIGLSDEEAFEALRVSWGLDTSAGDISSFIQSLREIAQGL